MSEESEKRSQWRFTITDTGWRWMVTRPDGTTEESATPFRTLQACADDARAHGYATWQAEERRQPDPKPFSGI